MTKQLFRGAMIGAGSIAPYHLEAWRSVPGVEIVAICNRTIERAESLANRFGIEPQHVYSSAGELSQSERQLDFVDIVTAPDQHRSDVEVAAAAGIRHILCQKPFSTSMADAREMTAVAENAGSTLTINENWRWRSWYRQLKALLDEGRIGQVRYVRIAAHRNVTLGLAGDPPPFLERQSYTSEMPHLIVFEWGIHLVDVLRYLLGESEWVHASMNRTSPHFKGEDRALMSFGFADVIATIDISWATQSGEELPSMLEEVVVEGDQGTISLVPNHGDGDLMRIVEPLPPEQYPFDRQRPWSPIKTTSLAVHDGDIAAAYQRSFNAAHQHFIDCWRTGDLPETSSADNLRTLDLVFAAYESAETRQVVTVKGM